MNPSDSVKFKQAKLKTLFIEQEILRKLIKNWSLTESYIRIQHQSLTLIIQLSTTLVQVHMHGKNK